MLCQILIDQTVNVGKTSVLLIKDNILYCLLTWCFTKSKQWQGCFAFFCPQLRINPNTFNHV
jgi:hypothetical protein